ncbi:SAM-dependent methyltransferase [Saccharopolyspora subtropica]|uniref:SAM-dependent methyltransferase n=1 Tax=Saccharopolyspora thermophila TaxID=89367 RepID=A0A917JUZ5_9PSEU|nr:SAM-dependent methyltransferase [Saccharopolyspora subtropica]
MERSTFEEAYAAGSAPWVIGEPQPAIVELERAGGIRGAVLDPGCGAGEHTILLTRLGYDVLGVDFSPRAVELARQNAARQQVEARFEVADALRLDGESRFDTVVDSALFHVFGPEDRAAYVRGLHRVCRAGGAVHVLALSDVEPGFGPRVGEHVIREAFGAGWRLEEVRPSHYRGVARGEAAAELGVEDGAVVDLAAWLATATRA